MQTKILMNKPPSNKQACIPKRKRGRPPKSSFSEMIMEENKAQNSQKSDQKSKVLSRPVISLKEILSYPLFDDADYINRKPILGISVFDERNLRKKPGRRFKNLDKFVSFKMDDQSASGSQKEEEDYEYTAKDIYEPVVWRNKININIDMDIMQTMEELWRCFMSMDSFEIDPDRPDTIMGEEESYGLKKTVDRGLSWLLNKISEAKLDPIKVTLEAPGDSNNDIVDALTDIRSSTSIECLTEAYEIHREEIFLTPHFLQNFDFQNALDRHYLKNKVRFMSLQLGFHARPASNCIKDNKHIVPFRCWVGSSSWRTLRDQRKKQVEEITGEVAKNARVDYDVKHCPFIMYYVREIDSQTGMPLTPFKLCRYNLIHSHPLSIEYERIHFDQYS